jgi:hypothetical protein
MRVPILEASVESRPAPPLRPDLRPVETGASDMFAGLDRALGTVGQAADRVASYAQRAAQKTANEAKALTVAEASLKAEDGWAAVDLEHQKLKGGDASAARRKAYDALDDVRKKTAEGIADPTARNEYLTRSAQRLADYHRRIDTHTLREYDKARDETLSARMKQARGAAAAGDPGKDKLAGQVEEEIRAAHPDASGPLIALFRSDMAFEMVKKAAGDNVEGAEQYLQTQFGREQLGEHYDNAVEMVRKAKGIAEKTTAKLEAESLALEVLKQATGPDGKLDGAKAKESLAEVPEASRIYVRTLVNEGIAADAMRRKAEFDGLKNEARKQLNHGKVFGSIDPKLLSTLEALPGGAEYVDKLKDDADRDARRREIKARGTTGQQSALAKEQKRANELALAQFRAMPRAEQAGTDLDEWLTGRGVDELGKARVTEVKTRSKEHLDSGGDRKADAFTRFAMSEGERLGILAHNKKPGLDPAKQSAFNVETQDAFDDFVRDNKRTPGLDEQRKLIDDLMVKHKGGWFEDGGIMPKTTYEFENRAAAKKAATPPAGDPLVRVRVKKGGAIGKVPRSKFNPALYEELPQ